MTLVRSIAFAIAFYLATALFLVLGSPLLLAPRSWAMAALRAHARTCLWLLRWIAGTRLEVRGRDKLPAGPFRAWAEQILARAATDAATRQPG